MCQNPRLKENLQDIVINRSFLSTAGQIDLLAKKVIIKPILSPCPHWLTNGKPFSKTKQKQQPRIYLKPHIMLACISSAQEMSLPSVTERLSNLLGAPPNWHMCAHQ